MPGNHLALVQDADLMTVGANRDRLAHQVRRHRVAIRVELDPRMRTDDSRHDLVGVEGDCGKWRSSDRSCKNRSTGRSRVVSCILTLAISSRHRGANAT